MKLLYPYRLAVRLRLAADDDRSAVVKLRKSDRLLAQFATTDGAAQWRLKLELYAALSDPAGFARMSAAGQMMLDRETADQLIRLSDSERMIIYEDFCLQSYDSTDLIDFVGSYKLKSTLGYRKSDFNETEMMSFEHVQIPVPVQYDAILRNEYGDYMQFVKGGSAHEGLQMDPDRPYREYLS